jgi:hypothetical protein
VFDAKSDGTGERASEGDDGGVSRVRWRVGRGRWGMRRWVFETREPEWCGGARLGYLTREWRGVNLAPWTGLVPRRVGSFADPWDRRGGGRFRGALGVHDRF